MTYLPEIREKVPVSPTAPPNSMALSFPMGVIVWPNLAIGLSPSNFTYSIFVLVIVLIYIKLGLCL